MWGNGVAQTVVAHRIGAFIIRPIVPAKPWPADDVHAFCICGCGVPGVVSVIPSIDEGVVKAVVVDSVVAR